MGKEKIKKIDEETPIALLVKREFNKCKKKDCPIDLIFDPNDTLIIMECQECGEKKQVETFKDTRN